MGILRLGKPDGAERLEAACRRAVARGALSYNSVESILKRGLDRQALPSADTATEAPTPLPHANLRGPDYYP